MKLHYHPKTDSLYVEFKPLPGSETIEVTDGLNVDIDADGQVVGFDIGHASQRLDLSTLETESLPLHSIKASLSPFPSSQRRPTADTAAQRNDLVADLAHRVFIAHAAPSGKTEAFARRLAASGKPILTLDSPVNVNLVELGAGAYSLCLSTD